MGAQINFPFSIRMRCASSGALCSPSSSPLASASASAMAHVRPRPPYSTAPSRPQHADTATARPRGRRNGAANHPHLGQLHNHGLGQRRVHRRRRRGGRAVPSACAPATALPAIAPAPGCARPRSCRSTRSSATSAFRLRPPTPWQAAGMSCPRHRCRRHRLAPLCRRLPPQSVPAAGSPSGRLRRQRCPVRRSVGWAPLHPIGWDQMCQGHYGHFRFISLLHPRKLVF
jgi:hypothetical protein